MGSSSHVMGPSQGAPQQGDGAAMPGNKSRRFIAKVCAAFVRLAGHVQPNAGTKRGRADHDGQSSLHRGWSSARALPGEATLVEDGVFPRGRSACDGRAVDVDIGSGRLITSEQERRR
jgi:hypothetical protein